MAVTKAEFKAVFDHDKPITDPQFGKLLEWMDAVYPKFDENGDPRSNTFDDLAAYMRSDITAKYKHWKADQTTVEF